MERQDKRCSTCKETKPVSDFGKHTRSSDGLRGHCKSCKREENKAWRDANPERIREYSRKWREENLELNRANARKWQEDNRERCTARMREYRAARIGNRDPNKPWPDGWCSYAAAHTRIQYTRGRASDHSCVDCGEDAVEWSYNHAADVEMMAQLKFPDGRVRDAPYSADISDYDPRCRSCHIIFDKRNA